MIDSVLFRVSVMIKTVLNLRIGPAVSGSVHNIIILIHHRILESYALGCFHNDKKGYKSSDAYKQAAFELGKDKPRFSQSGKPGFGEDAAAAAYRLAESAKQSAKFLRYKTSTVGGVREKAAKGSEKMKTKLKAAFSEVVEDIDKKWKKIEKDLNKFLSSDAFGELRNVIGSPVIEAVAEKINEGANIDDLLNLFKMWEDKTIDVGILTVWDTWEKMT